MTPDPFNSPAELHDWLKGEAERAAEMPTDEIRVDVRFVPTILRALSGLESVKGALEKIEKHNNLLFEVTGDAEFDAAQDEIRELTRSALDQLEAAGG